MKTISKLDSEVVGSISIPDNIGLSQTANLPEKSKLCVGARVMLTDNISVSGRLINVSTGTVKDLNRRIKPLCSTVYVKFDDPKAGKSLKDRRLCVELKECVPITARAKRFPLRKGKSKEKISSVNAWACNYCT